MDLCCPVQRGSNRTVMSSFPNVEHASMSLSGPYGEDKRFTCTPTRYTSDTDTETYENDQLQKHHFARIEQVDNLPS